MIFRSEKDTSHRLQMKFLKFRQNLHVNLLHKYENNGFNVSGDEITQKSAIHSPGDQSVFMIQSVDLSHIFGDELEQNWTGGVTKAKGPHHPQYS